MITHFRLIAITFLFLLNCIYTITATPERYASESVLNKGTWIKFLIEETGIYKITYADLKSLGFSDPAKVALCGYGGWPLEEDFSKPYIDDLPVVPVWKGNDYFLFYGRAKTRWEYYKDNSKEYFKHSNNPYSDEGFYFLTDAAEPKIMEVSPVLDIAAERISEFDDYIKYEKDEESVNESGKELFGDRFTTSNKTIHFNSIPGITDEAGSLECRMISKVSSDNNRVSLSLNNSQIIKNKSFAKPGNSYVTATSLLLTSKWETSEAQNGFNIRIDHSDVRPENTFIDYIKLQFKRELKSYNQPFMFFRSIYSLKGPSRFVIQNTDSYSLVFDVTNPINPIQMETKQNGSELSFTIDRGKSLREFVLIQSNLSFPGIDLKKTTKVRNQNLHGLSQQHMIIISPEAFIEQAQLLRDFHIDNDGLKVEVVTPEQVYNEFSSGTPDATAYRRFMKMFYDRSSSEEDAPRYLLLFGDGAYDNRFITPAWRRYNKTNYLLTYQTEESLNGWSYVVDDYFGFLDDNSGKVISESKVNIGIGRFPINTVDQAKAVVKKVISYGNQKGTWRNKVVMLADDGNDTDKYNPVHQKNANSLADYIENNMPEYIVYKMLYDAYKKRDGSGENYKLLKEELLYRLKEENLFLINYVGHGDKQSWSDEKVLTDNDISTFEFTNLPIWITATCDFCRFDYTSTSAGEKVFLNEKSGGIALFTTSRVAYVNSNDEINKLLIQNLFDPERKPNMTFGVIIKNTKRDYPKKDGAQMGFCLIGDPALKINFPEDKIEITTINGKAVGDETIPFKARDEMTIKGIIKTPSGQKNTSFNGKLYMTILDNWQTYETLGNNTIKVVENGITRDSIPKVTYNAYKTLVDDNLMAKVQDGEFSLTFTITEKIAYSSINNGKISMYALDDDNTKEAQGNFLQFQVGETSDNHEKDNAGPEIRMLYLNDESFASGDKVNATPYFVAKVWDQTGINISGSTIGHDIVLRIDNKANWTYYLNRYYQPSFEEEKEGLVQFSIPGLPPGIHQGEFIIWDKMGNSSKKDFSFEVVEGLKPNLYKLIASPNPARENVTFKLSHDRPKSRIKVTISVYDFAGRLLWSANDEGSSELFKEFLFEWDLISNHGTRIRPGIYLCRAAISTNGSKEVTEAEKLIVLIP